MAVAALQQCLERKDYAGAAKLITLRATLNGLRSLAAYGEGIWQTEAGRAYRESVAAWRADHEATVRAQQERDVAILVALVAEAVSESRRVAAASGWPQQRRAAA